MRVYQLIEALQQIDNPRAVVVVPSLIMGGLVIVKKVTPTYTDPKAGQVASSVILEG